MRGARIFQLLPFLFLTTSNLSIGGSQATEPDLLIAYVRSDVLPAPQNAAREGTLVLRYILDLSAVPAVYDDSHMFVALGLGTSLGDPEYYVSLPLQACFERFTKHLNGGMTGHPLVSLIRQMVPREGEVKCSLPIGHYSPLSRADRSAAFAGTLSAALYNGSSPSAPGYRELAKSNVLLSTVFATNELSIVGEQVTILQLSIRFDQGAVRFGGALTYAPLEKDP